VPDVQCCSRTLVLNNPPASEVRADISRFRDQSNEWSLGVLNLLDTLVCNSLRVSGIPAQNKKCCPRKNNKSDGCKSLNPVWIRERTLHSPKRSTNPQRRKSERCIMLRMGADEGRKRVIAIIAGILMARHLDRADDLFGGPQGSPRTDKMIAAAVQWATLIMKKVDVMVGN
jgi:hypothetical protein